MPEPSREILPPAPGVRVFRRPASAAIADCAPSGRVRLDAIARWLQDIAYADVVDAGLESVAVWVVRRTRVRVHRWPRFGERLALQTFCSGIGRMWAERRTDVAGERAGTDGPAGAGGQADTDRRADVEAVSLWVHLDPQRRVPFPLTEAEIATYTPPAGPPRRVTARLRHPAPAEAAAASRWRFRASECDIAGHVNNAAYWAALEEELLSAGSEPALPLDVELEYRAPAQPGDVDWVAAENARWLVGDGEPLASFELRVTDP